jgi:hypothetical protein
MANPLNVCKETEAETLTGANVNNVLLLHIPYRTENTVSYVYHQLNKRGRGATASKNPIR